MRNVTVALTAVCLAALLIGCGHNSIQYGDGVGLDFGVNQENWTATINLRYGKILTAVTRDNVEIELSGKTGASTQPGMEKATQTKVGTDGNLKVKIGRQINGAAVDLVKAGASADKVIAALANEKNSKTKPRNGERKNNNEREVK